MSQPTTALNTVKEATGGPDFFICNGDMSFVRMALDGPGDYTLEKIHNGMMDVDWTKGTIEVKFDMEPVRRKYKIWLEPISVEAAPQKDEMKAEVWKSVSARHALVTPAESAMVNGNAIEVYIAKKRAAGSVPTNESSAKRRRKSKPAK